MQIIFTVVTVLSFILRLRAVDCQSFICSRGKRGGRGGGEIEINFLYVYADFSGIK